MFNHIKNLTLILICILIISSGCNSTYQVTKRSELNNPKETGEINVLTKDGQYYELRSYTCKDSVLWGTGTLKTKNSEFGDFFQGEIKLSKIKYIEGTQSNTGLTIMSLGLVALISYAVINSTGDNGIHNSTTIKTYYPPSTGGGGFFSCPFVYTYDGKDYFLESETFSGTIFKAAEHNVYNRLIHLKPVDGLLKLKLTNERNETDNINELKILAVDIPSNIDLLPDSKGNLHSISAPLLPYNSTDFSGKDVSQYLSEKEGKMWRSDFENKDISKDEGLKDGVILEFKKPTDVKTAKLCVTGKNTPLTSFAFAEIIKLSGDKRLQWYNEIESNPIEAKKVINFMLTEGMLKIKVWDGKEWRLSGMFKDPGPDVVKEQAEIIDISFVKESKLKIKLECTTDLWLIDNVFIDYSNDIKVEPVELTMIDAITKDNKDVRDYLLNKDDKYMTSLPGNVTNITFRDIPAGHGFDRRYILKASGFYYIWLKGSGEDNPELRNNILTIPNYGAKMYMNQWKELRNNY